MNRLWLQLTLAFGLLTTSIILLIAFGTNRQVNSEFRRFFAQNQLQYSALPGRLAAWYAEHNSWDGVETVMTTPGHGQQGRGSGGMGWGTSAMLIADAHGTVVYDERQSRPLGSSLTTIEQTMAIPIESSGMVVGYVLMSNAAENELSPRAQRFLTDINQFLLQTGLMAGALSIVVGLLLARGLSAPLATLETAAQRISQGNLDHRVTVSGSDEMRSLAEAFNHMAASIQHDREVRQNMVADIAHELRTPLSVIQGNLRALLDDVYPMEKAEIATLYDETLLLTRLVHDLRELAQAEARQLSLNRIPTDLGALIERSQVMFAELAKEQQIAFSYDLPDYLPLMIIDGDRIQQVLYNLLSNAFRHTPASGRVTVQVTTSQHDPHVRVSVCDTGCGIATEDIPIVFQRFWRAEKSRSREYGGSGLGLAIARQIVEMHGGSIGVESHVGEGSCFWFTLPKTYEPPDDIDRAAPTSANDHTPQSRPSGHAGQVRR